MFVYRGTLLIRRFTTNEHGKGKASKIKIMKSKEKFKNRKEKTEKQLNGPSLFGSDVKSL